MRADSGWKWYHGISAQDPKVAKQLGERWQDAITDLCDGELLFAQAYYSPLCACPCLSWHLPRHEVSGPQCGPVSNDVATFSAVASSGFITRQHTRLPGGQLGL